ncbi:hypothetical protein [Planotetraspora silvatica]|nr:hypothetical protein [Planotetraspora silvatica]
MALNSRLQRSSRQVETDAMYFCIAGRLPGVIAGSLQSALARGAA